MFITDTVDAVYRPEEWLPEAMLDQLAEIAGSLPMVSDGSALVTNRSNMAISTTLILQYICMTLLTKRQCVGRYSMG